MLQPFEVNLKPSEMEKNPWIDIYAAKQNNLILNGEIMGIEEHHMPKGIGKSFALIVMLGGIKGLIPQQETGVYNYPQDENGEKKVILDQKEKLAIRSQLTDLIGLNEPVKIISTHEKENLVILSREKALEHLAELTWKKLKKGQVVSARVRRVRYNEVTLDIGGIATKIPHSDLSWGYVVSAKGIVEVGDELNVKILEFDPENKTLKVSHKETLSNPWPLCSDKYKKNNLYMGTVTNVITKGVFVKLEPGVTVFCKHMPFERVNAKDKVIIKIFGVNLKTNVMWGNIVKVS